MPSSGVSAPAAARMALAAAVAAGLLATTCQGFVPPVKTLLQPLPVASNQAPASIALVQARRSAPVMQSTASGAAAEASTSSSSETVLWLRGLSNTFDGTRYQFKDISLSLAKGACMLPRACTCEGGPGRGAEAYPIIIT